MNQQDSDISVLIAQIHLRVGVSDEALKYNTQQILDAYQTGIDQKCDVVLCPELAVSGYCPEDLLLRKDVVEKLENATNSLCEQILKKSNSKTSIVFGSSKVVNRSKVTGEFPQDLITKTGLNSGDQVLANAAIIVDPTRNETREVYKIHLPNWGVFDEVRWFAMAQKIADPIEINGVKIGIAICRDIWIEDTVSQLKEKGAQIILVPNASPFANARDKERRKVIAAYSRKYQIPISYVNSIQGCDEVVCEGGSFVADQSGAIIGDARRFSENLLRVSISLKNDEKESIEDDLSKIDESGTLDYDSFDPAETYNAITLCLREFFNSINQSSKVVVGLSGGIDSALVTTIAVDALGSDRVEGVLMPSRFTSKQSLDDANELAKRLNINTRNISIEKLHETAQVEFNLDQMNSLVNENIQPRLRGIILMMLSNSEGLLPLATSNKSESAVGYCTLYGDTVGAFAPIKDVYKTQVYALCDWRNSTTSFELKSPIPKEIILREPTAELRENQVDEQSLLPYEILDVILEKYIDLELSVEEIIGEGFVREDVERIIYMVNTSEFKRKQMPLGPRLTRRNFGKGRRIPISAKI